MNDIAAALAQYLRQRAPEASDGHASYWMNYKLPSPYNVTQQEIDAFAGFCSKMRISRRFDSARGFGRPRVPSYAP